MGKPPAKCAVPVKQTGAASAFSEQVISSLEEKLDACRTELWKEQATIAELRNEEEKLQYELSEAQDRIKKDAIEKTALRSQLEKVCDERDGLAEQLRELNSTVNDQAAKVKVLEKDTELLRKQTKK